MAETEYIQPLYSTTYSVYLLMLKLVFAYGAVLTVFDYPGNHDQSIQDANKEVVFIEKQFQAKLHENHIKWGSYDILFYIFFVAASWSYVSLRGMGRVDCRRTSKPPFNLGNRTSCYSILHMPSTFFVPKYSKRQGYPGPE